MTFHASKGLEFPIVIMPLKPTLERKTNISRHYLTPKGNSEYWVTEPPARVSNSYKQQKLEEEKRLCYVAFTRAKYQVYTLLSTKHFLFDYFSKKEIINDQYFQPVLTGKLSKMAQQITSRLIQDKQSLNDNEKLNLRYKPSLKYSWQTSYSEITSKHSHHDDDERFDKSEEIEIQLTKKIETKPVIKPIEENLYTLTKGSNTGNMLHSVLENIDFLEVRSFNSYQEMLDVKDIKNVIELQLHKYQMSLQSLKEVGKIIWNTLQTPLIDSYNNQQFFRLVDINNYQCEVEFYFNYNIDTGLFSKHDQNNNFVIGFVDLVFQYQGKYYILDWKSNSLNNYQFDTIWENMKRKTIP